jgi:pimeloyl-ACP methyl ester carboxylesterase
MAKFFGIPARIAGFLLIAAGLTGCAAKEPTLSSLDSHAPGPPRVVDVTKPGAAISRKVVYLDTRPGVTQGFLLLAPKKPVASAILFAGGGGRIRLQQDGQLTSGNFLVRTRMLFARRGIAVAVVDAASDTLSLRPVETRFGKRHQKDMEAVIGYLRQTLKRPVWLIGTSRGTLSVASIGANSRVPIDGLILTSSMTEVTEVGLGKVRVPAMVVANRNDACHVTPPDYAATIARALRTKPVYFESSTATGRACGAFSEHGFLGIEEKVVDAIARFVRSN